MFDIKLNMLNKDISNFQPLEVVGGGGETQLQTGENYSNICLILFHTFGNLDVETYISFPITVI